MDIEDERPSLAAPEETTEEELISHARHGRDAHLTGLERAVEEVRHVGIEASALLRAEGLKPSKLVYVPPGARSCPLFGYAFSRVRCGDGWHVVPGVIIDTDGGLWARMPAHGPTPRKDLDAWTLQVEPASGPLHLPSSVEYDGISLHTVRWVSDSEYVKADLIDQLLDGYARLLFLHQRRR